MTMNTYTEEEAKKLWCPMARTVWQWREGAPDAICVANRAEGDVPMAWCIASKCAAWQWIEVRDNREYDLWSKSANKRVNAAHGDDGEWRPVNPDEPPPSPRGYCGAFRRGE